MYKPKLDVHGLSIRGDAHETNSDHFAIAGLAKSIRMRRSNLDLDDGERVHGDNQGHVLLVADGISERAPERASRLAVASVVQHFLNEMPWSHGPEGEAGDVELDLERVLRNVQRELRDRARDGHDLSTTMTLAFVAWPDLYVAHVGDGRCYLHRHGETRVLTRDQSLTVAGDDGGATPHRTDGRVLWNAVGGRGSELYLDVVRTELEPGDVVALVTDGVLATDDVPAPEAVLERHLSSEAMCERLTAPTGADDRTAVVARFLPREPKRVEDVAAAPLDRLVRTRGVDPESGGRAEPPAIDRDRAPARVERAPRVARG